MKTLSKFIAILSVALVGACAPTYTTLRFTSNREAVAVRNPESPRSGDRLETLIGTRKKMFFYVPAGASVTSFLSSVDPAPGQKRSVATLSLDGHLLRVLSFSCGNHSQLVARRPSKTKGSFLAIQQSPVSQQAQQPRLSVSEEAHGS